MSSDTDGTPPVCITSQTARETSSRGASSSTKRSPSGPCSVAPSPRIASVTRNPSRPGTPVTAVGWNWTNSMSATAAPAARASRMPMPSDPGGFVVRLQSAAAPPVARIVPRAWTATPFSQTTPTTRPCSTHSDAAREPSRIRTLR